MERLVTTAQAAQILGLSLQGVHYRIKNNQLKSIKKSGSTYVYISDHVEDKSKKNQENKTQTFEIKEIINAKNEQISLLKNNIKWMRKQHNMEILRLEKNQKKIIHVFNREIELLQSAFNEMRSIYKPQIEQKIKEKNIEQEKEKKEIKYMEFKDFAKVMKAHGKSDKQIKDILLDGIKNKDPKFLYNKKRKKILIQNSFFDSLC